MSNDREEVRDILLDVADNIRREPDLVARVHLVDEFIHVAVRSATDLRDQTCYDLMEARLTKHKESSFPKWTMRRWQYGMRWARRQGLPTPWKARVGRPRNDGPDSYIEIHLPE